MDKYHYAFMIICLLVTSIYAQKAENNGEILFQQYCGRCHSDRDVRSGSIVYHSKKTLISLYKNKPRQLLYKLNNIDKYSLSTIMINAIHKIQDKKALVLIVKYLSGPDSPLPADTK